MDYAEQLLKPGMPPLDEIKDLKVKSGVGEGLMRTILDVLF